MPLIFCRRFADQYEQLTPQKRKLVPDAPYLQVQATVRVETALEAEDASRPKPVGQSAHPQGTAGSSYCNTHYARRARIPDAQGLMDKPEIVQEEVDQEKDVGVASHSTQ